MYSRLSRAEKAKERLDDAGVGADGDFVDCQATEEVSSLLAIFAGSLLELSTHFGITRIDAQRPTTLGIDEPNDTQFG